MHRSNVVRLAVVPGLITVPLTALRAWLEVNHPGEGITTLVSLNGLALAWILAFAVMMRRGGRRFAAFFFTLSVFCTIYRLAIGVVYTLAWAQSWRTVTGNPTRYQRDMIDAFAQMKLESPEQASAGLVFACTALFPIVTQLVFGCITWLLVRLLVKPARVPAMPLEGRSRDAP